MTSITDVRKLMEAAVGKLSPAKAEALARSLLKGEGKDRVSKAAQELLEWSQKNRQRIADLVRAEVRSQLAAVGVATKDELDALKKRVRELERGAAPKRATTRKPATRKATTRKATSEAAPAAGGGGGTTERQPA
ncbi:hypothetical protein HRbin12_00839 [bacterium HR12]|nr:hypothetical protein HRbin12_00839 [bacterium HR12]